MVISIFVHGFMGSDESFDHFPEDLKTAVEGQLGLEFQIHRFVYQTKGENAERVQQLIDFIYSRTSNADKVLLIAHSMGGLLCADAVREWCRRERLGEDVPGGSARIVGIIAFDSPFFGLARNVIAESGIQKASKAVNEVTEAVSSFWNTFSSTVTSQSSATTQSTALGTTASTASRTTEGTVSHSSTSNTSRRSLGWGVLAAATTLAAGAYAAYQSSPTLQTQVNTIAKQVVQEHTTKVVEHAQFLGPLWQVTDMSARMDFISSSSRAFFFHGFYLRMASTENTFIALPESSPNKSFSETYFSPIPILDGEDEIDAHMHLFKDSLHHYMDLMVKTLGLLSEHRNRFI